MIPLTAPVQVKGTGEVGMAISRSYQFQGIIYEVDFGKKGTCKIHESLLEQIGAPSPDLIRVD